jgi:hypothetical protein
VVYDTPANRATSLMELMPNVRLQDYLQALLAM